MIEILLKFVISVSGGGDCDYSPWASKSLAMPLPISSF